MPGAIAHIGVATAMGSGMAAWFGWSLGEGLVFGICLSVASTVVLLKALESRGLLRSVDGRIAVGWLIVEDLAMVVTLILLPVLAVVLGVIYGDASRPGVLDHAHLDRAGLLVVSAEDAFEAEEIVTHARRVNPSIDVVARTHSDHARARLEELGVGRAVMAEREMAMEIIRYAFTSLDIAADMDGLTTQVLRQEDPRPEDDAR